MQNMPNMQEMQKIFKTDRMDNNELYFTFTFTKAERGLLLWQDSGRIGNNWQHFPQVQVTFLNKWREQFSQQMEVDFLVELGRNYCFHRNFEGGSFEAILE